MESLSPVRSASSGAVERFSALRIAFVATALLVFTDGPLFFISHEVLGRPGPSWEDEVVAAGLLGTAAASGMLVAWDLWRTRCRAPHRPGALAAAAVACFALATVASTAWSVNVLHTGWRSVVYVGLALLAWEAADLGTSVRVPLAAMAAAGVAASLAVVAIRPGIGLDQNDDWQGIYLGRNLLAPVAAIGVIAGVRLMCADSRTQRMAGAALGIGSLNAMLFAGSRTAWLALLAGTGLTTVPMLRHWLARRWSPSGASAAATGALIAGLAVMAAVLAVMWDLPTFAQRRTIWRVCWEQFLERPLAGHGFSAIWTMPEFLEKHDLLSRGSAHNALLEVALGLGLLGLVPFVVIAVLAMRNAGRDLLRSPSADTWMWATVVAVMLIENVTESFILRLSYNWVIVMAAALRSPPRSPPNPDLCESTQD